MVMTAMFGGVDISAASRIFGHHHTTITHWIERCGHHCERLHERLYHQVLTIGHLQLDELVTKVKRDTKRLWVWTVVAAKTKLVLEFHIGCRSSVATHQLLHSVRDLLQLAVLEGVWFDLFPAAEGCRRSKKFEDILLSCLKAA